MRKRLARLAMVVGCCAIPLMSGGCNILGPVAAVGAKAFPNKIAAQYKGLAGQSVAVMVWAERGIRIDNPNLRQDICGGLLEKLKILQKEEKPPELEKTTFPVSAAVMSAYQTNHPEIEDAPITETASKFAVNRLIYIEVTDFTTVVDATGLLFRGSMTGTVKVVEIADGKTKLAKYTEEITVKFPKNSPNEGEPNANERKIYQGTVDIFTSELVNRFWDHDPED